MKNEHGFKEGDRVDLRPGLKEENVITQDTPAEIRDRIKVLASEQKLAAHRGDIFRACILQGAIRRAQRAWVDRMAESVDEAIAPRALRLWA